MIWFPVKTSVQTSNAEKFKIVHRVQFLNLAASSNFNNVLKQLTAISRQLNSGEDALSELHVLKEHWDCDRVLAEACVEQQCQRKCEVRILKAVIS